MHKTLMSKIDYSCLSLILRYHISVTKWHHTIFQLKLRNKLLPKVKTVSPRTRVSYLFRNFPKQFPRKTISRKEHSFYQKFSLSLILIPSTLQHKWMLDKLNYYFGLVCVRNILFFLLDITLISFPTPFLIHLVIKY